MKRYQNILFLICITWQLVRGQKAPDGHLFIKDHINFTLTSTWSHARDFPVNDRSNLKLRPDPGGRVGLTYSINLGKRFGIETGTYFGVQSLGYRIHVPDDPDFPLGNFVLRDPFAYVEIPFRLFGRFRISDKLYSYSYLGAHVARYTGGGWGASAGDSTGATVFALGYEMNYDYGMYLFFNLGTGLLISLDNEDFFRVNLLWHPNADGSLLARGNYTYWEPYGGRVFNTGILEWSGSYVGIEFGYVFSRSRELKRDLKRAGMQD